MPQVASETPPPSRPLPPPRANSAPAGQADTGGPPFESLIDDSLPPPVRDQGPPPQAPSQDAAANPPPAQTQADNKPGQAKQDGKTGNTDKTGKSGTDREKAASDTANADPQASAKAAATATDAGGTAPAKLGTTVTPNPLPDGDSKKADKSDKAGKDKQAKTEDTAKPADSAAIATPAAPDPTAAQTPAQPNPAHTQTQAPATAAVLVAQVQAVTPAEQAPAAGGVSPTGKTPVVTLKAVADIGGPAAKQPAQAEQLVQGTQQQQHQTPQTQNAASQTDNANPAAAPAPDSNQVVANQKSDAAARGEKSAGAQRFTLPDASTNSAANTQNTPAPSATNVAQNLNLPMPANQPAVQGPANVAPVQAPQAAAPVPLAGLAVAIAARASAGKSNFAIRLDPPELGRVDVRLSVDKDGHVTSHLVAERQDTLSLLQRDASGLQRALQDAGFKTADNGLQFSLRDFAQQQQQQQQQQSNGGNAGHIVLNDGTSTHESVPANYGRYLGRAGGVDIRV